MARHRWSSRRGARAVSGVGDTGDEPILAMRELEIHPLTPERWPDLETLFGSRGACGGCWCMTPRLTRSQYERQRGEGNRRALKRLVDRGSVPGVLGYVEGKPVAWCAIEPREAFSTLERSRIFQPVDEEKVWSIVCLFIAKEYRGKGGFLEDDRGRGSLRSKPGALESSRPIPSSPRKIRCPGSSPILALPRPTAKLDFVKSRAARRGGPW